MRNVNGLFAVAIGVLILWLAASGRLENVIRALMSSAKQPPIKTPDTPDASQIKSEIAAGTKLVDWLSR